MTKHPALLTRLFAKPTLSEVDEGLLATMVKDYPYFAHARWLWAVKKSPETGNGEALQQAAAFAYHPLRLESYLTFGGNGTNHSQGPLVAKEDTVPGHDSDHHQSSDTSNVAEATENIETPLIQPLFTEDYFAYTGARLPEHMENDKKPTMEQLHSFTDWLRTMKRPRGSADPDLEQEQASLGVRDENEMASLSQSADASLKANQEVYTEAMAEVRISAGQTDKAVAIYEKLSLHYPEKSAYFAQKIADLKSK